MTRRLAAQHGTHNLHFLRRLSRFLYLIFSFVLSFFFPYVLWTMQLYREKTRRLYLFIFFFSFPFSLIISKIIATFGIGWYGRYTHAAGDHHGRQERCIYSSSAGWDDAVIGENEVALSLHFQRAWAIIRHYYIIILYSTTGRFYINSALTLDGRHLKRGRAGDAHPTGKVNTWWFLKAISPVYRFSSREGKMTWPSTECCRVVITSHPR